MARRPETITRLQRLLEERSGMDLRALLVLSLEEGGSTRGACRWLRAQYGDGPSHKCYGMWLDRFGVRVERRIVCYRPAAGGAASRASASSRKAQPVGREEVAA